MAYLGGEVAEGENMVRACSRDVGSSMAGEKIMTAAGYTDRGHIDARGERPL